MTFIIEICDGIVQEVQPWHDREDAVDAFLRLAIDYGTEATSEDVERGYMKFENDYTIQILDE